MDRAGYDVHAPLLPGLGGQPEDIFEQTFSGWYAYVRHYYLQLHEQYDEVYLLGLSLGGALCLKLAEEFSESKPPRAAAVCSSPVFLNSLFRHGVLHQPLLYFSRWMALLFPAVIPYPRSHLYREDGADRWRGYHALLPRQIHSLKMGLKSILKDLRYITTPLFLCQSRGDRTVPWANLAHIWKNTSSGYRERLLLDTRQYRHSHHALFLYDSTRDVILSRILAFFKDSKMPGDDIHE